MRSLLVRAGILAALLCGRSALADDIPRPISREPVVAAEPSKLSFAALGGIAPPICVDPGCAGDVGLAPSLRALVLYHPDRSWGIGVIAQVVQLRWRGSYIGEVDGGTYGVESKLTAGFWGLVGQWVVLPDRAVSPVAEIAFGSAFQFQTGSNFNCNGGVNPTGQIGVGAKARVALPLSVFAMASASVGANSTSCGVSDGPPATPLVAWGYGLHVGAAFDVAVDAGSRPAQIADR